MKTTAIETCINDTPQNTVEATEMVTEAAAELDALTRLARLVVNEDGSDGPLVKALEVSCKQSRHASMGHCFCDECKRIDKALADARQAMEERE